MDIPKTCMICHTTHDGRGPSSLSYHLKSKHNKSVEEYYREFFFQLGCDVCKTCEGKTNWSVRYLRYNDFCSKSCQMKMVSRDPDWLANRAKHMKIMVERVYSTDEMKENRLSNLKNVKKAS